MQRRNDHKTTTVRRQVHFPPPPIPRGEGWGEGRKKTPHPCPLPTERGARESVVEAGCYPIEMTGVSHEEQNELEVSPAHSLNGDISLRYRRLARVLSRQPNQNPHFLSEHFHLRSEERRV